MVNPNPCDFDMEKPTLWSDIAKEGSPASKLMKVLELNKGFIDMKSRNLNEAMADHVHWQGAHGAISGWTWSSDAPTALEDLAPVFKDTSPTYPHTSSIRTSVYFSLYIFKLCMGLSIIWYFKKFLFFYDKVGPYICVFLAECVCLQVFDLLFR